MPAHEENPITYLTGDATRPVGEGVKIIAHVCNNLGKWGKGFVLAVSGRWPVTRQRYLTLYTPGTTIPLGTVQVVKVEADIYVANLIAQDGLRSRNNPVPLKYLSLEACLGQVATEALSLQATVHMPRIGCGLAGGEWDRVEPLIQHTLCQWGVVVCVYDLMENIT